MEAVLPGDHAESLGLCGGHAWNPSGAAHQYLYITRGSCGECTAPFVYLWIVTDTQLLSGQTKSGLVFILVYDNNLYPDGALGRYAKRDSRLKLSSLVENACWTAAGSLGRRPHIQPMTK